MKTPDGYRAPCRKVERCRWQSRAEGGTKGGMTETAQLPLTLWILHTTIGLKRTWAKTKREAREYAERKGYVVLRTRFAKAHETGREGL